MRFITRVVVSIIVNGLAIGLTAAILPGIHIEPFGIGALLLLGLVFGVINAIIRPVINLLSLPITILSLGLWQLVINALLLYLGSLFVSNLKIDNFLWALLGGIVMGIIGAILEAIFRRIIPEESRASHVGRASY
ncbi:MAG TPA: phage holin family protein [Ktedonobacterales bacterium]|jgi:putative membrane protein|nr:phage holin family protein [Ktedonobacterales bacterium]